MKVKTYELVNKNSDVEDQESHSDSSQGECCFLETLESVNPSFVDLHAMQVLCTPMYLVRCQCPLEELLSLQVFKHFFRLHLVMSYSGVYSQQHCS
jgi:hypothetical protein